MDDDFDFDAFPELEPSLSLDALIARSEQIQDDKIPNPNKDSQPAGPNPDQKDIDAVKRLLGADQPVKRTVKRDKKLDEKMLTDASGFPMLIKTISKKKFRSSESAHANNLSDLMEIIQLWGHDLLPKLTFKDFIMQSTKVCRRSRLKVFRDEQFREHWRRKHGFAVESNSNDQLASETIDNLPLDDNQPLEIQPIVNEPPVQEPIQQEIALQELRQDQIDMIENKKRIAMEKLAQRRKEREEMLRLEREREEANIDAMIAESGMFI